MRSKYYNITNKSYFTIVKLNASDLGIKIALGIRRKFSKWSVMKKLIMYTSKYRELIFQIIIFVNYFCKYTHYDRLELRF